MKNQSVCESIKYYTGLTIRHYQLTAWADKGFLGEVARFNQRGENSKQRDFNSKNIERAFLVVFITKILNMYVTKAQLVTMDKEMLDEVRVRLGKLETMGLPKIKHILMDREVK
jgi:hypothetical protein